MCFTAALGAGGGIRSSRPAQRAAQAERRGHGGAVRLRRAVGRAQLHEALGDAGGAQGRQGGPEPVPQHGLAAAGVALQGQESGQHAEGVAIQGGLGPQEGDGGDGGGGIGAEAGQGQQPLQVPRPAALRDALRGPLQVAGPAVVAQSLPGLVHLVLGGGRQARGIREPRHPAVEVRDHRGHLGLLQHQLGDEHGVGVRVRGVQILRAPGQVPAVRGEPLGQGCQEDPGGGLGHGLALKKRKRSEERFLLVPASRLELLRLVATTPSRWRVYQFHHAGQTEMKGCHALRHPSMLTFWGLRERACRRQAPRRPRCRAARNGWSARSRTR